MLVYYITKYALVHGILTTEGKEIEGGKYMVTTEKGWGSPVVFIMGEEAHLDPKEAEARAEVMRLAKIKSLKKELEFFSNPIIYRAAKKRSD